MTFITIKHEIYYNKTYTSLQRMLTKKQHYTIRWLPSPIPLPPKINGNWSMMFRYHIFMITFTTLRHQHFDNIKQKWSVKLIEISITKSSNFISQELQSQAGHF